MFIVSTLDVDAVAAAVTVVIFIVVTVVIDVLRCRLTPGSRLLSGAQAHASTDVVVLDNDGYGTTG